MHQKRPSIRIPHYKQTDMTSKQLLSHLPPTEVPANLFGRIVQAIAMAELRKRRNRFFLTVTGFASILVYTAFNWSALLTEIMTSSFAEIVRLAISDPDIAAANAHQFLSGLVETLPLGSILLGLTASFSLIAMAAMAKSFLHTRDGRAPHSLIPLN